MPIKTTLTYTQIGKGLEQFKTMIQASEVPFLLLKCIGVTDTLLQRYRSGSNTVASFNGLLIKKTIAYRAAAADALSSELEAMKTDKILLKAEPAILAVSDGQSLIAYDPAANETYENKLSKLYTDYSFFSPIWGIGKYRAVDENPADVKAAEKMAKIHDEIRRYNDIASDEDVHDLNIFMTRLLFCFFAEDTGIFDEKLFTNSIKRFTKPDGSDLSDYLSMSFHVMDIDIRSDINTIYTQFPYVNGGLFHKHIVVPRMGLKARKLILECGDLDWANINPDIFGSMIQAVVTPELRGGLEMHYTSVPNIMKLIGPLFLNDLHEEFYQLNRAQQEKKNQLDIGVYNVNTYLNECKGPIESCKKLLGRISKMKFFDPACGSGNFLIITYKQVRMLETKILKLIVEMQMQGSLQFVDGSIIRISQFYGIELDDFAHETAILSLWLAEHQMNKQFAKDFGVNIKALPLKTNCNIVHGNACRIDWESVCPHTKEEEVFVMGNPPYLGSRNQQQSHKSDMQFLFKEKGKSLDYIACWFYKGVLYLKWTKSKCAFVSTNSICQGEQVALLWEPILNYAEFFFAHTSFKWTNNAKSNAAVICVIIGIQNRSNEKKKLYTNNRFVVVDNINPYLTVGNSIFVKRLSKPISENFPILKFGNMPNDGGNLILSTEEKNTIITKYPLLEGIIRRFIGAVGFINGSIRWCLYLKDKDLSIVENIPEIKERLEKVYTHRIKSTEKSTRALATKPNHFYFFSHEETNSIIIPRHSSCNRIYIPIGYLIDKPVIADSALAIYNASFFIFGILNSLMHMSWVKYIGGKLKEDYRYSGTLCYNTFPFPSISDAKKAEIEVAANAVLDARDIHYEKTLAELYDPEKMPDNLREAHHQLDLIVESCYQNKPFVNDEERLECLFRLYEKMINK